MLSVRGNTANHLQTSTLTTDSPTFSSPRHPHPLQQTFAHMRKVPDLVPWPKYNHGRTHPNMHAQTPTYI